MAFSEKTHVRYNVLTQVDIYNTDISATFPSIQRKSMVNETEERDTGLKQHVDEQTMRTFSSGRRIFPLKDALKDINYICISELSYIG